MIEDFELYDNIEYDETEYASYQDLCDEVFYLQAQREQLAEALRGVTHDYKTADSQVVKLLAACKAALEWTSKYPFGNAGFEAATCADLYLELKAAIESVENDG